MPREVFGSDYPFLPRSEMLSFEEITRLARIFVGLGVEKIRLTGGEPLVRRDIEVLVEQLASIDGLKDLALTTNGSLLPSKAAKLKEAGLTRLTVSLDALNDDVFRSMNDANVSVSRVLKGMEAARAAGFGPIKVNMVVKRGLNEGEILGMASHFRGTGDILRFIEFMDVGTTNGWRMNDVVSAAEIIATVDREWPLEAVEATRPGEVAKRYRYLDGSGEVGVISSVSQAFCSTCVRARISARGELFTCLFGVKGHDLLALVRSGMSEEEIAAEVESIWGRRVDRYSEIRSERTTEIKRVEMSYIGG